MSLGNGFDAAWRYLSTSAEIINSIYATQHATIDRAARICADSIANDGLVFCWGGGHSRMSVEEMFPRIESFPGFASFGSREADRRSRPWYEDRYGACWLLRRTPKRRRDGRATQAGSTWPDERSVGAGPVLVEDLGCSGTAGIR